MGILESLLGAAMQGGMAQGGMAGGQQPQANPMAGALMQLLSGGAGPQAMAPQPQGGGLAGLVGGLLGGGGPQAAPGMGAMGGGAMGGMLASGIAVLVQQFSQGGYAEQAKSWVGTGANMPIAPEALTRVVGADRLSQLAAQYGIPREELAAALAEQLPQAVNELTPQGNIPAPDAMGALLSQFLGGGGGGGRRGGF